MATPVETRVERAAERCVLHQPCSAPRLAAQLAQAQARISQLEDTITLLEASLSMRVRTSSGGHGTAPHQAPQTATLRSASPDSASPPSVSDRSAGVDSPLSAAPAPAHRHATSMHDARLHDAPPQRPVAFAAGADAVSVASALSVLSPPRSPASHASPRTPGSHADEATGSPTQRPAYNAAGAAGDHVAGNEGEECSWAAAARDLSRGGMALHQQPPKPQYHAAFAAATPQRDGQRSPASGVQARVGATTATSSDAAGTRDSTRRSRRAREASTRRRRPSGKAQRRRDGGSKQGGGAKTAGKKGQKGSKKGKLEAWERKLTDEFVASVQRGEVRVARGELAKALRVAVNTERLQEFYEKLVSRRKLNAVLAPHLGPRRGKRSRALALAPPCLQPQAATLRPPFRDYEVGFEYDCGYEYRPAKAPRRGSHGYGAPMPPTLAAAAPWSVA